MAPRDWVRPGRPALVAGPAPDSLAVAVTCRLRLEPGLQKKEENAVMPPQEETQPLHTATQESLPCNLTHWQDIPIQTRIWI